MNKYESMIIVNPDLREDDVRKENQKITDLIAKENGTILKTDYVGKRTLAYLINKKEEGYYLVNYMEMSPKTADSLTKHYVLSENIMRFNFLRIEEDAIPRIKEKPVEKREVEVKPEKVEPEKETVKTSEKEE